MGRTVSDGDPSAPGRTPDHSDVTRLSITSRLRASRGVVVFVLAVLATPVIGAVLIHNVTTAISKPNYGIMAWGSPHVYFNDGRWQDVERDDRIIAVGETPIGSATEFREAKHQAGGPLEVVFERDGRRWTERVQPGSWSLSHRAGAWTRVVSALLLIVLGLVAYLLRPGTAVSILFLLMCYSLGCSIAMTWLFPESWAGSLVLDITLPMVAVTTLHIFLRFPEPSPLVTRFPRIWLAIYVPPAVLIAIKTAFDHGRPEHPVWRFGSTALWLWVGVALLVVLWLLASGYRRAARQRAVVTKARYRLLLVAAAVGMGVPLAANIAIAVFNVWARNQVAFEIATGAVVAFPIACAYVLVRQNAFEVDRFTAAVLGYAGTTAALVVGYGAALGLAWWIASATGLADSPAAVVAFVVAGAATLLPVSHRLKRRIDNLFARAPASPDAIIEAMQALRQRVHGHGTPSQAVDAGFAALDLLRGSRTELWLRDDAGGRFVRDRWSVEADAGRPSAIDFDSAIGVELLEGRLGGVSSLAPRPLPSQAAVELFALDLAMVATFSHEGQVGGFLAVGRHLSGVAFSTSELGLLATVAAEVGVALASHHESRVLGRYRLVRRLGVGGMAEVFLARQVGPGGFERTVAIKRPLPAIAEDPVSIARFLDEARIAARLHHDHIVQIYEVGVEDGRYFIVMEYVEGHTLRRLIAQARASQLRPPVPVALAIIDQILDALEHVHSRTESNGAPSELIHRDVTPSNVLVADTGNAKLVDFGIAHAADRLARTRTGGVRGTAAYMSPEQANAVQMDRRTDIYSTACVAYELLALERPDRKGSRADLTTLVPELPAAVARAIDRALANDRERRFATAREFSDALRDGLGASLASSREVAAWVEQVARAGDDAAGPSVGSAEGRDATTRTKRPSSSGTADTVDLVDR